MIFSMSAMPTDRICRYKSTNNVNNNEMSKIITGISMDEELKKQIDEKRGLIPRSTFVSKMIQKGMREE